MTYEAGVADIDMDKSPVVAGFGSCRIVTPLAFLARTKVIVSGNEGVAWYTHSIVDAIQKLEIVEKRRDLPQDMVDYVIHSREKYHAERHMPLFFNSVDLFVVEVASIKVITFRNLVLQQWCLRDRVIEAGFDPVAFMRLLGEKPAVRKLDEVPPALLDLAREGTITVQTGADMQASLHELRNMLRRPLIIVPHINVEGRDGKLIAERMLIEEQLRQFCKDTGETFFDLTTFIRGYGIDKALKDLGHYHAEFDQVVADQLSSAIKNRLGRKTRVAA